ncbi:hypothetical protein WJX73_004222 [Symbiochloris irregularis]|uniref:Uncharacterized protein n=1 Tax=Symbiochloris irregularis TaxID=706552 RepID=A0AAW1NS64_9CHLO
MAGTLSAIQHRTVSHLTAGKAQLIGSQWVSRTPPSPSASNPRSQRTQYATARQSAIRASGRDFDRKVQDAGRKIEGTAQEAQERAPQQAQEAKGAASQAGQEAQQQFQDPSERSKFVAEFSAMALFTFLTSTASAAATAQASGAVQTLLLRMGAFGLIFPLIISIFAPISKAHFNPMVTVSMVVAGQQKLSQGINYIIAQCLGAILGGALALWSLPGAQQNAGYLAAAAVPAGRSVPQAFLGEFVGAVFFIWVLFQTIVDPRGWGKLGPLSLGLAVPLLMWTVGPISGLSINPARAFGLAVVLGDWTHHWVWWVAPIIGAALAGKTYSSCFAPTQS